ncbi:MAG TPA: M20/M25/M40 family metallo-hydrolase [Thermoanaerobaculia bacterium]|nr:M20/M25/M40 family metallo-hydrolase [Thermoanaerobaculia bacterium]
MQRSPARPAVALALALAAGALGLRPAAAADGDGPVRWLSEYLRIDTSNPPGNEGEAAAWLAGVLHRHGVATQRLVSPGGRTSLYARLAAPRPEAPGLLLLHHLDVVPPGEGWQDDPFSGEIRDGRVHGRGAIDAKSLGVVHLAAFLDAAARRARLRRDLVLLAVADEEAGGAEGLGWLIDAKPELFAGIGAALNEGGTNRVVGGRVLWWGIEVAQKRPLWLRVSTRGRGGHASGFHPNSATHRLVARLGAVLEVQQPPRVTEHALLHLRALAPLHGGPFARVFGGGTVDQVQRALDAALAEGRDLERILLPGMLSYLTDTIQLTTLDNGNASINVVSPRAAATLDVRLLPDTDADAFVADLRSRLGDDVAIEVLLATPPAPASSTATDVYAALEASLGSRGPVIPAFILGTTDSRHLRRHGIDAYGFSPFVLGPEDLGGIHGPNESIPVRQVEEGAALMRALVAALALPVESAP